MGLLNESVVNGHRDQEWAEKHSLVEVKDQPDLLSPLFTGVRIIIRIL
ncbi:MAG: hypothetical protein ACLU4J_12970 [Butyricimonas paravirosa]